MSRNRILIAYALVMMIFGFAGPAPAEEPEGRFSLTPHVGIQSGFRFGKLLPLPQTADVPDVEVLLERRSPVWGAELGWKLSRHFEFQGEALYGRAEIINDVGIGFTGRPIGKVNVSEAFLFSAGGRILCQVHAGKFSPYVSVGGGAAHLHTREIGSKTKPYIIAGSGIRAGLTHHLHGSLEVVDLVTFFDYGRDFRSAYVLIYRPDFRKVQHSGGLYLGLSYYF